MESAEKIKNALFILRLGVFIVMFMWTLDKFINPDNAARVFETFYFISGFGDSAFYLIGFIQLLVILAFVSAYKRPYSYLAVLIMHAISTLSSFARYLDPWTSPNLLFFAAWPMLAAIFVLYYLRDLDTKFSLDGDQAARPPG